MAKRSNAGLSDILDSGDYDSSFEGNSNSSKIIKLRQNLVIPEKKPHVPKARSSDFIEAYSREEGRIQRYHYLSLNAYSRHKELINNYYLYYPGATKQFQADKSHHKRDIDVIKEHHKFLWDDEEDEDEEDSWGKRLARKYYDKLFKEYCIADLSRYKENKTGMRWRTEKEVVGGKGQFTCGARGCNADEDLTSWEVNFAYIEQNEKKNALVKLRLCVACSKKLNYHRKMKEVRRKKKKKKKDHRQNHKKIKHLGHDKVEEEVPSTSKTESSEEDEEGDSVWNKPQQVPVDEDKSKDEEMDDFLEDLFM